MYYNDAVFILYRRCTVILEPVLSTCHCCKSVSTVFLSDPDSGGQLISDPAGCGSYLDIFVSL
jgi:hypothetical protein